MWNFKNLPEKDDENYVEGVVQQYTDSDDYFIRIRTSNGWTMTDILIPSHYNEEEKLQYIADEFARVITHSRNLGYEHAKRDIRRVLGIKDT